MAWFRRSGSKLGHMANDAHDKVTETTYKVTDEVQKVTDKAALQLKIKKEDTAATKIQAKLRSNQAKERFKGEKRHMTSPRCIGPLVDGSAAGAGPTGKYSVIQWETVAFYTYEGEINGVPVPFGEPNPPVTKMSVGVARLGCSEGRAKFQWSTFDMSAKGGVHYKTVKPTWVVFEDGETYKDLVVEIYPRDNFDGTTELGMYIDETSVVGAVVGKYLHTATIKIIDTTAFPHDKLRPFVHGGNLKKIKDIDPGALVWYFIKICTMNPVCWAGTKKAILAAQWHSLTSILQIFILFYLIQTLTDVEASDAEKYTKVVFFAGLWLGPFAITHYLSYRRQFWKVGGSLRKFYQALLLKKFLNYTDNSRSQVAIESLVMAMVRDVNTAVGEGYLCAIDLVFGSMMKIMYLIGAMLFLQSQSDSGINLPPLIAVSVLPFLSVAYLKIRQRKTFELRGKQFKAENSSVNHVIKSVINYQLVADYDRRTFMIQTFESRLDAVNATTTQFNAAGINSRYFTPWVTTIFVAFFIVIGGSQVIAGGDLAAFLSTISLFRALGGEFEKAYMESLRITAAYASIAQVTMYLNLPVDVPERLKMTRSRRKFGRELRTLEREGIANGTRKKLGPSEVAADRLPLMIKNVEFSYGEVTAAGENKDEDDDAPPRQKETKANHKSEGKGVKGLALQIGQGKLVSIVGPPSQGKATIMRLLAGQVFPKLPPLGAVVDPKMRPELFVPPHLRVVQIQENPLILGPEESIFENLVYGIKKSPSTNWVALEERAFQIMDRLGLSDDLLHHHFKESGYLGAAGCRITRADRQLISLGRAFVMNPEIIIMHKPTALLDDTHTEHALDMFREFVENRGLFMPDDEPLVRRRRRTLIFTAKNEHVASKADEVYVAKRGQLERIVFDEDCTQKVRIKKIKDAFEGFKAEMAEKRKAKNAARASLTSAVHFPPMEISGALEFGTPHLPKSVLKMPCGMAASPPPGAAGSVDSSGRFDEAASGASGSINLAANEAGSSLRPSAGVADAPSSSGSEAPSLLDESTVTGIPPRRSISPERFKSAPGAERAGTSLDDRSASSPPGLPGRRTPSSGLRVPSGRKSRSPRKARSASSSPRKAPPKPSGGKLTRGMSRDYEVKVEVVEDDDVEMV